MNERLLFEQMLDLYASQRESDQKQRIRCQRGEHDMLATASPGVVVCQTCRRGPVSGHTNMRGKISSPTT